jgi:hypothetical protein
MLYTGRDRSEHRRMGLAHSPDGVRWERIPNFLISGSNPWDSQVICDPSVEQMPDGSLRVWFGGGDVRRPDQGLHGQIGVGTSDTYYATPQRVTALNGVSAVSAWGITASAIFWRCSVLRISASSLALVKNPISASTLGICAPISTTNGAFFTPRFLVVALALVNV